METKCKKMPVSFFYQKDGRLLSHEMQPLRSYDVIRRVMFQKEIIHLFESKC